MFVASGLGPFSGQSVHFQRVAPEKISYAMNPIHARPSAITAPSTIT